MALKSFSSPSDFSEEPKRKVVVDDVNEQIRTFKKFKGDEYNESKWNKQKTGMKEKSDNIIVGPDGEKLDWKKVKQERKDLKLKRKHSDAKGNDTYEIGVKAKQIWEELRKENCEKKKKTELCKELFDLIKGKVKSIIYAHDTVRVIETLVGLGGEEYSAHIYVELKDDLLNLCKNKYSRFFVIKLLRCGTKEQKIAIMKSMEGHIVELIRHKVACDVVELAYNDYANATQRSSMIQEFFGPRFRLFKEEVHSLEEALKKHPDQKKNILSDMNTALQPVIDKGVFTNTLVHTLLKEYMYACDEDDKKGLIENLKEGLLPILHTRDGSRVAMQCIWFGSAKDRKLTLKSLKKNYVKIALEEHGHMVLLAIFDSVDDTVFLNKVVLSELMEGLEKLIENENGRKVLKYLVAPRSRLFFHPHVLSVLEVGDDNPYSKKDKLKKYKELQDAISQPILNIIKDNISVWSRNPQWTLFIGAALQSLSGDAVVTVFESIAEICSEPFLPGEGKHFLEIAYMSKMVSFLIQCDKERFENNKPLFSTSLIAAAETELRGWTITNRGCFIVTKLLETEIPEVVEQTNKICSSLKGSLKKLSFPGADILCKKLENN